MIRWNDRQFEAEVKRANVAALKKACVLVVSSVKESFGDTGVTGATRKQRHANRSKADEPPHVDTGALKRSITYEIEDENTGKVGAQAQIDYAILLELGTRNMEPRPYLRPAIIREKANILKCFKDIL